MKNENYNKLRGLARYTDLIAAFAAVNLAVGAGCVVTGAVYAALDRDLPGRAFWETGLNALILGCGSTALAARASRKRERQWMG